MKPFTRRAWVIGVDGKHPLDPLGPDTSFEDWHNHLRWSPAKFHVLQTVKDRGIARFRVDYGARVQSVLVTCKRVPRCGKRTFGWRPDLSPWEWPCRGIRDEDLACILVRRSQFGGRKGARAMRRMRELSRQCLRHIAAERKVQ